MHQTPTAAVFPPLPAEPPPVPPPLPPALLPIEEELTVTLTGHVEELDDNISMSNVSSTPLAEMNAEDVDPPSYETYEVQDGDLDWR